ncbi:MAG: mannosyltransferase family protein [Acidimicrobiales bacterium]
MSRIALGVVLGHLVVVTFPGAMQHSRLGTLSSGTWLGTFDRWDAAYYTTIAAHGYPTDPQRLRAFFPGYPLIMRSVYDLAGGALAYSQAGCLVSWTALVLSALLLYRLVDDRFGSRAALVSVVLLCWFPTSCFLLAPYSEALFILEILMTVTLADRGAWWSAAMVGGYASATSPEGLVLALAIGVAAIAAHRGVWRASRYTLLGTWGLAAYSIFLDIRFGDPLSYVTEQRDWHRVTGLPFANVVENIGAIRHVMDERGPVPPAYRFVRTNIVLAWMLNDAVMVLALAAVIFLVATARRRWVRGGEGERQTIPLSWIIILGGILGTLSVSSIRFAGSLISTESDARLLSVAFPIYPALHLMVRRWSVLLAAAVVISIAAALLFQAMFNLGYWVV